MDMNSESFKEIIFKITEISYRAEVLSDSEGFQESYRASLKATLHDGELPEDYEDISIYLFQSNEPFDKKSENAIGVILPIDKYLQVRILCRPSALSNFMTVLASREEIRGSAFIDIKIPKSEDWENRKSLPILEYGLTANTN